MTDDPLHAWKKQHGAMLDSLLRIETIAAYGIPDHELAEEISADLSLLAAAACRCLAALSDTSPAEVADVLLIKGFQLEDWPARREAMAGRFSRMIGANEA